MSYYDYKQQYTYGFGPIDFSQLTFATYATKYILGENNGAKVANGTTTGLSTSTNDSGHTKPIDLKAARQMFHKKALLDFLCLESFAPLGTQQVVKLTFTNNATSAGKVTIEIKDETPVEVSVASGNTPAQIASACKDALGGLKNWTAGYTASNAYFTLTRKVAEASWTATDTDNFKATITAATTTGAWAEVTAGVAVESDTTHVFKVDVMTAETTTEMQAHIEGSYDVIIPVMSVYVKGNQVLPCSTPAFECLMPSNLKEYTWLEISMPKISSTSTTMTSGKMVFGFDKN